MLFRFYGVGAPIARACNAENTDPAPTLPTNAWAPAAAVPAIGPMAENPRQAAIGAPTPVARAILPTAVTTRKAITPIILECVVSMLMVLCDKIDRRKERMKMKNWFKKPYKK